MEPAKAPPPGPESAPQQGTGSVRIAMDPMESARMPNAKSGRGIKFHSKNASSMVRDKLRSLDTNHDGTLDEAELIRGIEELVQETRMRKMFMFLALGLFLVVLVLIGAIGGMTYGIIEATKETKVSGTVLVTSDGKSAVVQTANYDMTVQDGVLVSRAANGTGNAAAEVLRAAPYTTQQAFSSRVDIKALMEMKYFYVKSTEAEMALAVLGVGRVPKAGSVHGTVVKILTLAGTIVLDDRMISFTEDMAPIFSEAGFVVDVKHRRLLGVYDIFGFFAYIQDMAVFNLPPNEPKPALPSGDFQMVLKVWEPCVLDYDGVPENRCHYTPGHANYTQTNATTTSGRHLLGGANFVVIPGVVTLEDGKDYMASTETVTRVGSLVKTVYEFAAFPDMIKVEVLDESTKNISSWQAYKPKPASYVVDTNPYWCNKFKLPNNFFDKFARKNISGITFTFVGYATIMGTPARHFKLVVPQPPDADGSAQPPMTVDYYDNADTHYPLYFDFYHHMGGHMMIHIESFAMLNSTTRPAASFMQTPAQDWCDGPDSKPDSVSRIGSAFTLPPELANYGNATAAARRRQLLAYDQETGLPRMDGPKARPAYLYDPAYSPDRPGSPAYNRSIARRSAASFEFTTECNVEVPMLSLDFSPVIPCKFDMVSVAPPKGVKIAAGCGGGLPPPISFIELNGEAYINTCAKEFGGCLKVGVSLIGALGPFANLKPFKWLREKIPALQTMDILQVCGGYNYDSKMGWVKGSYSGPPIYLWVIKGEIAGTIKFDDKVTYVESIGMEIFAGIDFGFWSAYTSIGSFKFVENWFWRGSQSLMEAAQNPVIINYAADITPTEGYWGQWSQSTYCSADTLEPGQVKGVAVKGVQVRMEGSQGSNDDTGLNAIRFLCSDESVITPHEGFWGTWSNYVACPGDEFITAARMRIEVKGGKNFDDTAANALEMRCSGGSVLAPDPGLWGTWTEWKQCPDKTFVCGLKVRVEDQQGDEDDTVLNGATLFCCKAEIDDGKSYPPPAPTSGALGNPPPATSG